MGVGILLGRATSHFIVSLGHHIIISSYHHNISIISILLLALALITVDDPPENTMMTIEIGHNRITFREDDDEDELKEVFSFLDAKTDLLLASAKVVTNEEEA